ncbi:MAG: protein translocase subunit SecDF [Bacteroidetes bacterium]|nr:protein translocase subunit SecDF [Bacteroidota bacterium]
MKNKGLIRIFAVLLAIISLYQLSFNFVIWNFDKKAEAYAGKFAPEERATKLRYFKDSIGNVQVYNLLIAKFTYKECKENAITLGLDLQGGMNVTLEVSQVEFVKALSNNNPDPNFNLAVDNTEKISITSQRNFIDIFYDEYKKLSPDKKLAAIFATPTNKTINFNSSDEDVLKMVREESSRAIDRSYEIIRSRIDKFGVTQPTVQKLENQGRILVELPGADDPERVRKLLQSTAKLEFWETYANGDDVYKLLDTISKGIGKSTTGELVVAPVDTTKKKDKDSSVVVADEKQDSTVEDSSSDARNAKLLKENPLMAIVQPALNRDKGYMKGSLICYVAIKDTSKFNTYLSSPIASYYINALTATQGIRFAYGSKSDNGFVYVYALKAKDMTRGAVMDGAAVASARQDYDPLTGQPDVSMQMTPKGAQDWAAAPNVMGEIAGGNAQISGGFTVKEAQDLANILQTGKLPAPCKIIEEVIVGPSLGKEAIRSGLLTLLIAFISIIVFMILYYNIAGVSSDIAVIINLFFILGVLASLHSALTLPGFAGIVLTLAVAVDANVLINERVKEEMRDGKNMRQSVSEGYKHALSAIIDSHVTGLMAGIVLTFLGTGPIKGFAVVLIIGIITSLFTAIFITRLQIERWLDKGRELKFSTSLSANLFKGSSFDWVGKRKIYYIISGTVILLGAISMFTKGFSLGVDFKGGWSYVVKLDKTANTSEVAPALAKYFDNLTPQVKTFGSDSKLKITTTYKIDDVKASEPEVRQHLLDGLTSMGYVVNDASIESSSKIGATMASDAKYSALRAIFIAIIGMFIYIVIRFRKWQFGVGATVALFHDVFLLLSFFSILDGIVPFSMDLDQDFIAAILTVLVFSMNDTVVVFDRIREYLNLNKKEKDRVKIINYALNATLSRTIVTAGTIFMVCLILFLFGGPAIKGFSFALLIGVVVGTYSSLCIATPVVVDFGGSDFEGIK